MVNDLNIYPTYLSLLQSRQERLRVDGVWDGREGMVFQAFSERLLTAGRTAYGIGAGMPSDLEQALLILATVRELPLELRNAEPVAGLGERALRDVLSGLCSLFFLLGEDVRAVLELMSDAVDERLRWLAALYREFESQVERRGYLSPPAAEALVLRLVRDRHQVWPAALTLPGSGGRTPLRLCFRSLRWLTPFQERLIQALVERLGVSTVQVESTLPSEFGAGDFLGRLSGLIHDDSGGGVGLAAWVHDLADAWSMADPNLLFGAEEHIDFSRSAGVYGEVEDLARRIRWEIEEQGVPANRIALVVRDVGEYSDAVVDVFERFGLPYFFRRGVPAASVPLVKAVLALADFRSNHGRDTFCGLLESPWVSVLGFTSRLDAGCLAEDIRRSGVRPFPDSGAQVRERLWAYYEARGTFDETYAEKMAAVERLWDDLKVASEQELTLGDQATVLRRLLGVAGIQEAVQRLGDEKLDARNLNTGGWGLVENLLTVLVQGPASETTMTARDFAVLLVEMVSNQTVEGVGRDPDGVWVINPYDASGLVFDTVLVGGLNAGRFPARTVDSSLVADRDREWLRKNLPGLPRLAMPTGRDRGQMENILFMTSLGCARRQLVLSYQSCDADGRELVPSIFFSTVWQMAGWGHPEWPARAAGAELSAYDQWRLAQPGTAGLKAHFAGQKVEKDASCRVPFPGESFLSTIPLSMCLAGDEARQRLCSPQCRDEERMALAELVESGENDASAAEVAASIRDGIAVTRMRQAFQSAMAAGASDFHMIPGADANCSEGELPVGSAFTGAVQKEVWRQLTGDGSLDLSVTALEKLMQCPFRFLLEQWYRVDSTTTVELEPDPRDRGTAIHEVMRRIFRILSGTSEDLEWAQRQVAGFGQWRGLCSPWLVVEQDVGRWKLADALPGENFAGRYLRAVRWQVERCADYRDLAMAVLEAVWQARKEKWNFGDPRLNTVRYEELRRIIGNFMTNELVVERPGGKCPPWLASGTICAPALFEFAFGNKAGSAAPCLQLFPENGRQGTLLVHGVIDRVDLLFDEGTRELTGVRVLDYKGMGRARRSGNVLRRDIAEGSDCQLPLYGLAALAFLCPQQSVEESALAERTFLQYYGYSGSLKEVQDRSRLSYVALGDRLSDEASDSPAVLPAFLERVRQSFRRLRDGVFTASPVSCAYCPYPGVCRVRVSRLEQ